MLFVSYFDMSFAGLLQGKKEMTGEKKIEFPIFSISELKSVIFVNSYLICKHIVKYFDLF